ncbi:hypothetical protein ACFLSA_02955 [Bacteroidota bacterium]
MAVKIYRFLILVGIILILTYCERELRWELITDCDECYLEEPDYEALVINLTKNSQNDSILVTVFSGTIEKKDTVFFGYIDTTILYVDVPLNKYYSAIATYKNGEEIVMVYDGDRIKTKYKGEACDKPCYVVRGGYLDLRIKSEFIKE